MKRISDNTAYFAAANTFSGFKSNFKSVFAPEKFDRIFIIKGGPGTGKSTLMKRIGEYFAPKRYEVTRFLCSSDTSSLDGLTVSLRNRKIAILDGTSPHTTDPEMPGACEKIINLTEALNYRQLCKRKKEIASIDKEKKTAYEQAYKSLSSAGEVHKLIWFIIEKSEVYKEAEEICDNILDYELFTKSEDLPREDLYFSAFGKNGYERLDVPCIEKEYISVIGDGMTEQIIMRILRSKLLSTGVVQEIGYSPLSSLDTDVITTESCVISTENVGNIVFDTTPLSNALKREYTELLGIYKSMLTLSQSCFESAAIKHAELERIYSSNIDFGYNERCVFEIIKEIEEIL